VFSNDHDNQAGLGIGKDLEYVRDPPRVTVAVKGVKGRYRCVSTRDATPQPDDHYTEVQVYGK